MTVEYLINVEYANGVENGHLTFNYDNSEVRNDIFSEITLLFAENTISQRFLSEFGGIIIKSHNYNEPSRNTMADIVPYEYFDYKVLNEILELLEKSSIRKSENIK